MCATMAGAQTFPVAEWKEARDPIAAPEAEKGGSIVLWGHSYPQSLNYYLAQSSHAADVFEMMYSTLMEMNAIDLSFEPGLAQSWEISDDKTTFTLTLDPRAKWSDGKPVTSHDVKWTVETILDSKNLTGAHKIDWMRFDPPEVIDERTIRFVAKEAHWKNLLSLAGLTVLPKHAMEGMDFNKINFEFPVVSGPYRIKAIKEGFSLTLERRNDWWMAGLPRAEGIYNFDEIKYRYIEKREDAYAAFQQGQTELHPVYTSRIWVKETKGKAFDQNWIVKKRVFNYNPSSLQAYVFNLRNPLFQDVRVRKALELLNDRQRMNETIMYSQYALHRSYFEDIYDKEHPNPHDVVPFDPEKARKLLDEAGWIVNPKTGYREKDGKRFSFTFLYYDPSTDKFLTIFDEALKDAGIEMIRERKDWAAWAKDMDEFNFEMSNAAWRGGLFKDPESMWHSNEAARTSGMNYSGFKNEEVDRLIERGKTEFDIRKRTELLREIDRVLVKESPYMLEWYAGYTRLLYWNKFGMPETVLNKYSDEASICRYWWRDEDKAEELEEARANGFMLPAEPVDLHFDEMYAR